MRKIIISILLGAIAAITAHAQDCTTTWPYLYQDFVPATLHLSGAPARQELVNIHTLRSKLHYIDAKDQIKELDLKDILIVELNSGDKYAVVNFGMMQMFCNSEQGFVGLQKTADLAALNETGGAYGTSSASSSTMKVSSIEVAGANVPHMELLQHKGDGESLPLKQSYYLVVAGKCIKASKKDVGAAVKPEFQNDLKAFMKANKIKWNSPESLSALIPFLAGKI